jgi:hypothetical protein
MAAAAFGGRVILSSLLAEFVDPSLPGPQRRLYRYQTYAEGRVMACRERCSLWQVYLHVFVMVIRKIEFSLCVVFYRRIHIGGMKTYLYTVDIGTRRGCTAGARIPHL